MARPQVADRRNDLQICRLVANLLISSRGQPIRDGPAAWELVQALTTLHIKKIFCSETITQAVN